MGSLCERFSAINQDIKVWLKLCESYSSLAEDIFVMLHSKPLAAEKPFIFFSAWLMVLGQKYVNRMCYSGWCYINLRYCSGKAQDCERVFQMGLPKMPQNMAEKFVQKFKEIQVSTLLYEQLYVINIILNVLFVEFSCARTD